jgi:sigma-E factor negative regulatory protein RseA
MTVTKNERLSALVDNEADGFEVRRLLDELGRHEQDMALWERYHLIGDAVRGGLNRFARRRFADEVMARIDREPAPVAAGSAAGRRLVKPVAGMAMAATVAVAALVGFVNFADGPEPGLPVVAEAQTVVPPIDVRATPAADLGQVAAAGRVPGPAEPAMAPLEASDARIHSFIVNHAEHAAGRGLMPYVRVVGYESLAQ